MTLTLYTFCASVPILEVEIDNLCDLELLSRWDNIPILSKLKLFHKVRNAIVGEHTLAW